MTETSILRILTCGSVDDGKSTLIGRLIAETRSVPEDVLESARWTRRTGSTIPAGEIDFSLLTDGLEAEREQGITIDVAYRHLDLENNRRAIIADAPGHEQYTRNMAVAASTADVAILLVDAARGVRTQTFRHLSICAMMRVSTVVIAINKMDAVAFDQTTYNALSDRVNQTAQELGIKHVITIPVSALSGDFVTHRTDVMPWYDGPTLLEALRTVDKISTTVEGALRLPVQLILRSPDYRGYAGQLVAGQLAVGDEIKVGRSGVTAKVESLTVAGEPVKQAIAGQAVGFTTDNEIDITRGDVIIEPSATRAANDRYAAELVWMHEKPLARGRSYWLISNSTTVAVTVTNIRDKMDVETGHRHSTRDLQINEIGHVEFASDSPVFLDDYSNVRETGGFLLVDRGSNDTAAAGMVLHEMRRGINIHEQVFDVDRATREELMGHRGRVLWFTGLSGSGKSTIASEVQRQLHTRGIHTYVLDGDNVRLGLNKDLGFTPEDRAENVRRVGETAKLMMDAGLVVLVCLVSPFREDRDSVRAGFAEEDFVEIYVDTPFDVCVERDVKGLYARAQRGEIPNMTGMGQDYEAPLNPDLTVAGNGDLTTSVSQVIEVAV
ncbi:MAG: bifunctional enzyme CysN/cysC, partial [Actinomycetota bacterium]